MQKYKPRFARSAQKRFVWFYDERNFMQYLWCRNIIPSLDDL